VSGYSFTTLEELGDDYGFRKVRRALGVTAFGVNALVLPPGFPGFHHWHDSQDELYFVHRGSALVTLNGESVTAAAGAVVAVEPGTTRKFEAASSPTTLLVVGGTPGKAYEVGDWEK
jgi:mannose-6-phosphate isomerase-like protein (cupin superfamily)